MVYGVVVSVALQAIFGNNLPAFVGALSCNPSEHLLASRRGGGFCYCLLRIVFITNFMAPLGINKPMACQARHPSSWTATPTGIRQDAFFYARGCAIIKSPQASMYRAVGFVYTC